MDFEFFLLILLATLGMFLLISSKDLILLYLSIETISLSLYVLAAIQRTGQLSTEAGLKYFLLGALSSGLLLFGSAIIYLLTGLTNLDEISYYLVTLTASPHSGLDSSIFVDFGLFSSNIALKESLQIGVLFVLVAFLFKMAAGPFHM